MDEETKTKQMVAALDDIRAIAFGRGDSVTKLQKIKDCVTRVIENHTEGGA